LKPLGAVSEAATIRKRKGFPSDFFQLLHNKNFAGNSNKRYDFVQTLVGSIDRDIIGSQAHENFLKTDCLSCVKRKRSIKAYDAA